MFLKHGIIIIIFLFAPFFSNVASFAKEKLTVGMSFAVKTDGVYHVITDGKVVGGIEYDTIVGSLADYEINFRYVPMQFGAKKLQTDEYDCISPAPTELKGNKGFFGTKNPTVTYVNQAITLKSKSYKISGLKDMYDKNVISFPGATKYLGPDFKKMAEHNKKSKKYKEVQKIANSSMMVFKDRVDVVFMDKWAFTYAANSNRQDLSKVAFHDFFPSAPYTMLCKSEAVAAAYDKGYMQLDKSGKLNEIFEKNASAVTTK